MVIKAIAVNAFKEAIRDKILYNLLIFTVIIIAASVLLGRLTIGQDQRVIKDVGLASMSLFGMLIATFVGTNLVHKEIRRKTIYTIFSKPIKRYEFILGKYLGLLLTILVNLIIMNIVLFAVLGLYKLLFANNSNGSDEAINYFMLLKAVLLILFELMLITSIAILFSTISSPTLSIFFTLGAYVVGHLTIDLKEFGAASQSEFIRSLSSIFYYLLPNLENFNIRAEMVRDISVSSQFIFYVIGYGIIYISAILLISILSMEKKEFI
jgi:ABC-type transport system involved in multi-copper enzyme maturation permease subunit